LQPLEQSQLENVAELAPGPLIEVHMAWVWQVGAVNVLGEVGMTRRLVVLLGSLVPSCHSVEVPGAVAERMTCPAGDLGHSDYPQVPT